LRRTASAGQAKVPLAPGLEAAAGRREAAAEAVERPESGVAFVEPADLKRFSIKSCHLKLVLVKNCLTDFVPDGGMCTGGVCIM